MKCRGARPRRREYGRHGDPGRGQLGEDLQHQADFGESLSKLTGDGRPIYLIGSGVSLITGKEKNLKVAVKQAEVDVRPSAATLARYAFLRRDVLQWKSPWELQPQYVQRDIGWKKLGEQGRRA